MATSSRLERISRRGRKARAPLPPPGSEIPVGETPLDKLTTEGETLLARASKVLGSTDRPLGKLDVAQRFDAVLQNLDSTTSELRGVVRPNEEDVRATVDSFREASRSFKTLGRELRRQPNRLLFGRPPPERELP